jgi:hypothetical protein
MIRRAIGLALTLSTLPLVSLTSGCYARAAVREPVYVEPRHDVVVHERVEERHEDDHHREHHDDDRR